ncbi:MAG: TatD family hydrolase [Pseudomonadota bacterium]
MWFDAGVNLTNQRLLKDLDGVLAHAETANVGRMLVIATNEQESRQALRLCDRYPAQLLATVGVHPHDADQVSTDFINVLADLARHPAVVAIGECGLDFNRNFSSQQNQQRVFAEQISLANRLNLPLYLHERDAQQQQIQLLDTYCGEHTPCLSHCFTGGVAQARAYLERGHWFGITGWLTDERRNHDLLQALPLLPTERVVIETDAPFLLPRNIKPRPKFNEPALLPVIGQVLASHWSMELTEVAAITRTNSERLFNRRQIDL